MANAPFSRRVEFFSICPSLAADLPSPPPWVGSFCFRLFVVMLLLLCCVVVCCFLFVWGRALVFVLGVVCLRVVLVLCWVGGVLFVGGCLCSFGVLRWGASLGRWPLRH